MRTGDVTRVGSLMALTAALWSAGAVAWPWRNAPSPADYLAPAQLATTQAPVIAPLPLPRVVHPTEPGQVHYVDGTGFFVTTTGYVLTARHIVENCNGTKVMSPHLPRTPARLVAADGSADLALLFAAVRPPGLVGIAERPPGRWDLTVFGHPSGGDAVNATEATVKARTPPEKGPTLWLDAAEVRAGFSGGPVVNADGAAAGLIQGVMYRAADGKPQALGIAVGPDARTIDGFLRRSIANLETARPWGALAGDTAAARKAVVRVLCRR